jgi:hypothetical protein
MAGKRSNPVVYLATAPNEVVAAIWADILAQNGVHCVIRSDNMCSAQYVFIQNMSREIDVLASKLKKAGEILEPFLKASKPETVNKEARKTRKYLITPKRHLSYYVLMWAMGLSLFWLIVLGFYVLIRWVRNVFETTVD